MWTLGLKTPPTLNIWTPSLKHWRGLSCHKSSEEGATWTARKPRSLYTTLCSCVFLYLRTCAIVARKIPPLWHGAVSSRLPASLSMMRQNCETQSIHRCHTLLRKRALSCFEQGYCSDLRDFFSPIFNKVPVLIFNSRNTNPSEKFKVCKMCYSENFSKYFAYLERYRVTLIVPACHHGKI